MNNETPFEKFLSQQNEESWSAALATLLRSIHEVDRNATQIWFAFFPLSLFQALAAAENREQLAQQLLLQGDYDLKDQIDSSHRFLYGHRFWPQVKQAIEANADSFAENNRAGLADQILEVARAVSQQTKTEESLLVGITAVGFMTLRQTGLASFKSAAGAVTVNRKLAKKSPEDILRARAKDDSRGLFGFLKTINNEWTVTWDETDAGARYKLREGQDLAWGAADDQSRDWRAIDPRRSEGPIPVECRAASCGTCWVGVLGGAPKLSDVGAREGKKMKEFGYIDTAEPKPLIRLACQAQANGAVSIVIPPWNGQFGKFLRSLRQDTEAAVPEQTSASAASANETVN